MGLASLRARLSQRRARLPVDRVSGIEYFGRKNETVLHTVYLPTHSMANRCILLQVLIVFRINYRESKGRDSEHGKFSKNPQVRTWKLRTCWAKICHLDPL